MHSIASIEVPTGGSYDLTTVEAVNAALGLTSNTANDAMVALAITQASKVIAALCYRTFAFASVTETFRADRWRERAHELRLTHYPVSAVQAVTEDDTLLDPDNYELKPEPGLLYKIDYCWWLRKIVVQYEGGYNLPDEAPPLLAQATIETIRARQSSGTRDPTIRSTTHGDTTVTFFDPNASGSSASSSSSIVPDSAAEMIALYRRLDT